MEKQKVVFYKSTDTATEIEADAIIMLSLDVTEGERIGFVGVYNAVPSQDIYIYMIGELLASVHTLIGPEAVLEALEHYKLSVQDQEEEEFKYHREEGKGQGKIVYHYKREGSNCSSEMPTFEMALDCAQWDYEAGGATGDTEPIKIVQGDREHTLSTLKTTYGWKKKVG